MPKQKYGIIENGQLIITGENLVGAKPIVYEDVPEFNQTTHYAKQQTPVDAGNHIFMGVELHKMEVSEGWPSEDFLFE